MNLSRLLKNMDLYLLDQILKGRINEHTKILDAGCGTGRNSRFFIENGYQIKGFDPSKESISALGRKYPKAADNYVVSDIEGYEGSQEYGFVICNAVLHFAESHTHFRSMMEKLSSFMSPDGLLFIRMTSEFAIGKPYEVNESGRSSLPDGTERYLLSRRELTESMIQNGLYFVEPLKTVNVNDERCMSTLLLTNDKRISLDLRWLSPEQHPMMK